MREITNGIHTDISIEEYHANKTHISATQIKYAKESLRHFQWYMSGKIPREEKSAFGFGNAFELALLSHGEYLTKVAVAPEQDWIDAALKENPDLVKPRSSKVYQKSELDFIAANRGKYLIRDTGPESFETIEEMLLSCESDKTISALIDNTEYQVSLFWTDEETGIGLKTRPDICKRKKNVLVNVKTIEDGSPDSFTRELQKWDYPTQACIEIEGALRSGLMPVVDNYLWLVVEKKPPYNATIYEFAPSDIAACADGLRFLLARIKKGRDTGIWPGYGDMADNQYGILTAKLPPWYRL
jgi:exodeoxyribonuclease VIII